MTIIMTIKEVYEKYKHMDKVICDPIFKDIFITIMLKDFWQAIKQEIEQEKPGNTHERTPTNIRHAISASDTELL